MKWTEALQKKLEGESLPDPEEIAYKAFSSLFVGTTAAIAAPLAIKGAKVAYDQYKKRKQSQ